jgi:hypothetical protein
MKISPSSNVTLGCKVWGLLMADSLHTKNQHVLVFFTFFILAEERASFTPYSNVLEVAVAVLYLTYIGSASDWANHWQRFIVSLTFCPALTQQLSTILYIGRFNMVNSPSLRSQTWTRTRNRTRTRAQSHRYCPSLRLSP